VIRGHITLAKKLRAESTDAERRLWSHLRAHRFLGLKFRRQHPIGEFIVDFVCPELKLIVELDGGQHSERAAEDAARTSRLQAQGFVVVRYWNNDVMNDLDSVIRDLERRVEALRAAPLPCPLPAQRGEGE
jgi:very-short-patch-repair endonuclease